MACLHVNCQRPVPEGAKVCLLHDYWSRVVLADPKYRFEVPPTPEEVEPDLAMQLNLFPK